jgi:hypothetical protein
MPHTPTLVGLLATMRHDRTRCPLACPPAAGPQRRAGAGGPTAGPPRGASASASAAPNATPTATSAPSRHAAPPRSCTPHAHSAAARAHARRRPLAPTTSPSSTAGSVRVNACSMHSSGCGSCWWRGRPGAAAVAAHVCVCCASICTTWGQPQHWRHANICIELCLWANIRHVPHVPAAAGCDTGAGPSRSP